MKYIYGALSYLCAFNLGMYAVRIKYGEDIEPHKVVLTALLLLIGAVCYYREIKNQQP